MNTLTFLNSPLLWGLALASIPILIHLLYRRQYRRIDWAPMKYLKLSIQRNRRRVRIEQLLLLLVRTCIVLLLFFVLARPMIHAAGLSRWFGGNSRTNRIVLVDDSLSMGYSVEGKTALTRAQEVASELIATFGPKDRFTLLLASQPRQPVLREVELADNDAIVQAIRQVGPTEVLGAWEPIVQAIDELIVGGSYPLHEVTLITDLRKAGWESSRLTEVGSRWAAAHAQLRVFDVGIAETSNVALASLEQVDRLALIGTPVRFEAEIRNDSGVEQAGLEANFVIDGKPTLVRVPTLAPNDVLKLPLLATFQDAGTHHVALELPADSLVGDNSAWAVVDVQQTIDILLVDGETSNEPLGSETDFLSLALSLSGEVSESFRVEVMTDSEWAALPTVRPDLLVIANVAHLGPDVVDRLQQQVAEGMGLMIFVGDQVDPDNYNQVLFRSGDGLLPAAFEGISDAEFSGLLVEAAEGSPLSALSQLSPAVLQRIKIRKTYDVKVADKPDLVRVLARWNNAAGGAAIIERVFGSGRVLLWTTAADRSWSDWPTEASYVLATREAARAVARSTASLRRITAGEPIKVALPASHDITLPAVEVPGNDEPKPLVIASRAADKQTRAQPEEPGPREEQRSEKKDSCEIAFADTRRSGIYKMTWRDSVAGPTSETFAANPDARESDLARLAVDDFKALWGALEAEVISLGAAGASDASVVRGREIWRTLATGLLGLLVFEACFARWAGRQR
jgi:hypothetical protein